MEGLEILRYTRSGHFIANREETRVTMTDFWRWSYLDFLDLWEFFSVPAAAMSDGKPAATTLPRLMEHGV